ncbi:DUF362 domain-containing protein [Candidatus Bipolaricaulota bacterium]|nr:DUF362 domain-containing protein [Candidatus Bipolaricaulota bacterium]
MAMRKAQVAVVRASGYELGSVRPAVERALDLIGGLESVVRPGARVFVKINHLPPPSPPERGIITHPKLAEAVLTLLRDLTPHIALGDDIHPANPDGFTVSGYRELCRRLGVELVNLRERGFVRVPCAGVVLREVFLARAVAEAEVLVDLPKLKTHSLTLFTGAVKNMYGAIPAGLRTRYHGEYPKPAEFGQLLVDIFSVAKPHLTVMDGIMAMEGAGPANGTLRPLGLVLAGRDAVAVDAVASRIIGIDPFRVGTTKAAHERGLGVGDLQEIEVLGEPTFAVAGRDFRLPPIPAGEIVGWFPQALTGFVTRRLRPQPKVATKRCVGCGACAAACPTGAAQLRAGKARIDRRRCIQCMCCHEACRFGAIVLPQSRWALVLGARRRR